MIVPSRAVRMKFVFSSIVVNPRRALGEVEQAPVAGRGVGERDDGRGMHVAMRREVLLPERELRLHDAVLDARELDAEQAGEEFGAGVLQLLESGIHGRDPTLRRMARAQGEKTIVDNRRARHDYHLSDRVEAGLVLTGTEVKALRDGKATLQQAYADVRDAEAWLVGLHIPEYGQGNRENHDPNRPRKLLLHRREIDRMYAQVREKGMTIVPTRLYFKDGRVKAELALGKGKDLRDKRRDVSERDAKRDIERAVKSGGRSEY